MKILPAFVTRYKIQYHIFLIDTRIDKTTIRHKNHRSSNDNSPNKTTDQYKSNYNCKATTKTSQYRSTKERL